MQQKAGTQLRAKIIGKFKETRDLSDAIDSRVQALHDAFINCYDRNDEQVAKLLKADT